MADQQELLRRKKELLEARRKLLEQQSLTYEVSKPTGAAVLMNAIGKGASLGFKDEIGSGIDATAAFLTTPGDRAGAFKDVYDTSMMEAAARDAEFARARPLLDFSGQVAGGTGIGGVGGALAMQTPLRNLATIPRVAGAGAIEGGLYGMGTAPPGERLEGLQRGALTGMVGGPATMVAGTTAMAALRPAVRRLGDALLGTPRDRAVRIVRQKLAADEITPDEAIAMVNAHPGMTIADLGDSVMRAGRVTTSRMGPAASKSKRFLDERQLQANQNLRQRARAVAAEDNTFDGTVVSIINDAESAAAPIYREVYSEVLDVDDVMLDLLNRPAARTARTKAATLLKNEGFSDEIINDVTDVRYMDAVKRALDDMEGAALRAGNRNQARVLGQLRRDLVEQIDAKVPRYAEARQIFAGEAKIKEAAEFGRNVLVGKKMGTTDDIVQSISEMTPNEKKAARIGFLDWLTDEISRTPANRMTVVNRFENVPRYKDVTRALFDNQRAVSDFLNEAGTNAQFARTRNFVTGGSPTARIQDDVSSLESGVLGTAVDAMISPSTALAGVLRKVKGNTQLSDDVLDAMGDILFNPNVVPRDLQRGPAGLLDIPRMQPLPAAGAAGGFYATGIDPYVQQTLRDLGIIGQ